MKKRSYQNWAILTLSLALMAQAWAYNGRTSVRAQGFVAMPCAGEMRSPQATHARMDSPQSTSPFARGLAESMDAMHRKMMSARLTGDPDQDFLVTMLPHHQGAIDMSKLILLHGRDERVRRLAQGIIVEQQSEIDTMRRLLAAAKKTTKERK